MNHPPAHAIRTQEEREHRSGERGHKRPLQYKDFDGSTEQYARVDQYHPSKMRFRDVRGSARGEPRLMPPRDTELREAQQCYSEEEPQKCSDAYVHGSCKAIAPSDEAGWAQQGTSVIEAKAGQRWKNRIGLAHTYNAKGLPNENPTVWLAPSTALEL